MVTDLYDAGERLGLMCQLEFEEGGRKTAIVVASAMQIAVDRRYSAAARVISDYQKNRRDQLVAARHPVEREAAPRESRSRLRVPRGG